MLPRLLLLAALAAGPLAASPQTPLGPGTAAGPATPAPIQGPWNVLVVLTDQQHASALGIAGNGFGGVPTSLTPNLDALAEDGVLFESAYCAQAQCCPSRYSLITGLEPHRHGLRFNGIWEPTAEVTVPELLRDAGYETATIGKHHFRWLSQSAPLAFDHGFSEVLDLSDYRSYCNQNGVPTFDAPGHHWRMPGLPVVRGIERSGVTDCPNEFHPSGYFADRAIDYLSERAQDRQPFYCHLSFYGPHSPILPSGTTDPRDFAHAFFPPGQLTLPPNFQRPPTTQRLDDLQQQFAGVSDAQHRELLAYYFGLIHQIDFNIGRVLDHLEQVGLADRTLVVFTSDHGEFASEFGVWTKALGGLEATARVPLIARLPVGLRGERRSELVTGVDLAPTVLELTGVPVPSEVRAGLSGRSWLPLLLGEPPAPAWRSTVFGEARGGQVRYARNATHKVIEDASVIPDVELYDLASDPFEVVDLLDPAAPGSGAIRDALLAEIDDWWGDPLQHAPDYRDAGAAADLPVIASAPLPANGANGVPTDVDFAWLRSSASQSQAVYLGTAPGALQPLAVLSGKRTPPTPARSLPARPTTGASTAATPTAWPRASSGPSRPISRGKPGPSSRSSARRSKGRRSARSRRRCAGCRQAMRSHTRCTSASGARRCCRWPRCLPGGKSTGRTASSPAPSIAGASTPGTRRGS